jgi:Holliday junction resolvasome RuvABC endonuclease subunit
MIPTLALDTALATGFCWSNGDELLHGVWHLGGASLEHAGAPLVRLERNLTAMYESFGFRRLVFERAAYGGNFVKIKQFHNQVRGVLLLFAARNDLQWADYSPSTIKKFATDHGHATKDDMVRALKLHFGITVRSDDEADAIWILKLDEHRRNNPLAAIEAAAKKPKAVRERKKKAPRLF